MCGASGATISTSGSASCLGSPPVSAAILAAWLVSPISSAIAMLKRSFPEIAA